MNAFLFGGVKIAPAEVVKDSSGEEYVLLEHNGNLITEKLKVVLADIRSAYSYRASVNIVQAADEVRECGFTAAGSADDADSFTRMDMQVDVREDFLAAVHIGFLFSKLVGLVLVRKAYMFKVNGAVRNFHYRILGVRDI